MEVTVGRPLLRAGRAPGLRGPAHPARGRERRRGGHHPGRGSGTRLAPVRAEAGVQAGPDGRIEGQGRHRHQTRRSGEGAAPRGGGAERPELHSGGVRPLEERGPHRGERRGPEEGGPRCPGATRLGRRPGPSPDGEQAGRRGDAGCHRRRGERLGRQRQQPLRRHRRGLHHHRGERLPRGLHRRRPPGLGRLFQQPLRQGDDEGGPVPRREGLPGPRAARGHRDQRRRPARHHGIRGEPGGPGPRLRRGSHRGGPVQGREGRLRRLHHPPVAPARASASRCDKGADGGPRLRGRGALNPATEIPPAFLGVKNLSRPPEEI